MSTNMARTPLAARITIDPSFSDGYESNQSGELGSQSLEGAEIRSPIDLTSRTPTHIRFVHVHCTSRDEQCTDGKFKLDSRLRCSYVRYKQHHHLERHKRCRIPISLAFRAVMNATSEGLISDPTFKGRGIIAIHIEGMHPQSVVSTSSMYRGRIRRRASRNIHIGTA